MWQLIKKQNPVWYLDATGNIHKNVNSQNRLLFYTAVMHDIVNKQIIPFFDFISSSHTVFSITKYLNCAKNILSKITTLNLIAPVIVCDFSWPLINSALLSFNNCTMNYYLKYTFSLLYKDNSNAKVIEMNNDNSFKNCNTYLYLCSTHFLKSMIKKSKYYERKIEKTVINTFIFAFSLIQNSITVDQIENYMINVYNIFQNKYLDKTVTYSLEVLKTELINRDLNKINVHLIENEDKVKRDTFWIRYMRMKIFKKL